MPLLCLLGRHAPLPVARWNDGYYFSRCRRCGCDLVRTAYGKWFVPTGYRVVWQAGPPPGHSSAQLEPLPATAVAPPKADAASAGPPAQTAAEASPPIRSPADVSGPGRSPNIIERAKAYLKERRERIEATPRPNRLPISELLGYLREKDRPESKQATNESQTPRRPIVKDFLSDDPDAIWVFETPGAAATPDPSADELREDDAAVTEAGPEAPAETLVAPDREAPSADEAAEAPRASEAPAKPVDELWPAAAAIPPIPESPAKTQEAEPAERAPALSATASTALWGVLVASLIVMVVSIYLYLAGPTRAIAEEDGPDVSQLIEPPKTRYVAASLLQCRSAPSAQARSVRKFRRGTQLLSLSNDGDWESVAYRNRQCWVRTRYLSDHPPL